MKLQFIKTLIVLSLFVSLQSCTVPSSYEPVSSNDEGTGTNTGTGSGTGTGTGTIALSGSQTNNKESHNMGRDCISCHYQGSVIGGEKPPVWQIGGTVYNADQIKTYPNTVVKLFTEPNGAGILKYTLNVDGYGNFYTSANVDFTANGLYPAVTSTKGTNYMSFSITTGACNSCHTGGTGTARITAL